jgi:hypothetical protein
MLDEVLSPSVESERPEEELFAPVAELPVFKLPEVPVPLVPVPKRLLSVEGDEGEDDGVLPAWANAEAVPSRKAQAATEKREGDWIGDFIPRFGTRGAKCVPQEGVGEARITGWFDARREQAGGSLPHPPKCLAPRDRSQAL